MQFDARLTGEAATLARDYGGLLRRLPATVHAFVLVQLRKWAALFAAEQRYQRALLAFLSELSGGELLAAVAGIARIEAEAGIDAIASREPVQFQDEAQARLRRQRRLQAWRAEIDRFFQQVDPAIEAQLYPPDAPRRLLVQIYAGNIAVQADKLWSRFKGSGVRVPLTLGTARGSERFLRALFGSGESGGVPPALFGGPGSPSLDPLDLWIIESHDALHQLWDGSADSRARQHSAVGAAPASPGLPTGLSFDRLRAYRDELTRALYDKIKSGVESPQAFAAHARGLKIAPAPGALRSSSPIVQAFVRDLFLTGNGTLFVNNTFVEWAAVETLRRAQPRVLVTRFGVRDKLKPFSSLLLFSQPRASDQIPIVEDPVGSFIDVEQLAYYVWLNAEKSAAYRRKTLYLFLAEGIEEMLAIRSDAPVPPAAAVAPATLADVSATMAQWLGIASPAPDGRAITALVA